MKDKVLKQGREMTWLLAFSDEGRCLAEKIRRELGEDGVRAELFSGPGKAADLVARDFRDAAALLFVGATGIAVRLIAPHIGKKDEDPAVLVVDDMGRYVIPILSGHIGGANRLAERVAEKIGAEAVITTATDIHDVFSADQWASEQGLRVADTSEIKFIAGALLRGETVGFKSEGFCVDGPLPPGLVPVGGERPSEQPAELPACGIYLTAGTEEDPFLHTMRAVPRCVSVGAGCRKGTDATAFEAFLLEELEKARVNVAAVSELATIDLKKDESCIRYFCEKYRIPVRTYTAEELMEVPGVFAYSERVLRVTGADNVCERAAVRAALERCGGRDDEVSMILGKTPGNGMTAAIALTEWRGRFPER